VFTYFFTTQGKYIQAGIILVNLKYSEEKRQDSSVTKLGEFTPISYVDDCFLWAVLFDTEKVTYVLILPKSGLGYTLADFFTNSSGHPVNQSFFLIQKGSIWVCQTLTRLDHLSTPFRFADFDFVD
jgi:hypothetical protein